MSASVPTGDEPVTARDRIQAISNGIEPLERELQKSAKSAKVFALPMGGLASIITYGFVLVILVVSILASTLWLGVGTTSILLLVVIMTQKMIPEDELGLLVITNKPVKVLKSGWYWLVVPGICKVPTRTIKRISKDVPGETDPLIKLPNGETIRGIMVQASLFPDPEETDKRNRPTKAEDIKHGLHKAYARVLSVMFAIDITPLKRMTRPLKHGEAEDKGVDIIKDRNARCKRKNEEILRRNPDAQPTELYQMWDERAGFLREETELEAVQRVFLYDEDTTWEFIKDNIMDSARDKVRREGLFEAMKSGTEMVKQDVFRAVKGEIESVGLPVRLLQLAMNEPFIPFNQKITILLEEIEAVQVKQRVELLDMNRQLEVEKARKLVMKAKAEAYQFSPGKEDLGLMLLEQLDVQMALAKNEAAKHVIGNDILGAALKVLEGLKS